VKADLLVLVLEELGGDEGGGQRIEARVGRRVRLDVLLGEGGVD
jgi:hypothetical protein